MPSHPALPLPAFGNLARRSRIPVGLILIGALLGGCASVPLRSGGTLSSYDRLRSEKGLVTKTELYVDREAALRARTVRIVPTSVAGTAVGEPQRPQDVRLVANAVDRALCVGLSDRFVVVSGDAPADLTVHAAVTDIVPTNAVVSGVSTVATLGASAVSVPVPRLPFGLGGLAVEAEAQDATGTQVAAIVWARGANAVTERARASRVGDAYALAFKFGDDFSGMLNRGKSPFGGASLPSGQKIRSNLGGRPKYVACESFGRAPGVGGLVTGQLGLPPGWSDRGSGADAR